VIGVFCEVVFIILDHFEDFEEWEYARTHLKIRFPSRPNRVKLAFEILSVAAVVGGIIGELHVEARLGQLDNDIQNANNQRVALLDNEASAQRLRAACAEKQLVELERATLPRTTDISRVASKLPLLKGINISVASLGEDEGLKLADQIRGAFMAAGWTGTGISSGNPKILVHPGIWIEANPPSASSGTESARKARERFLARIAIRMQKALSEEALAVEVRKHGKEEADMYPNIPQPDSISLYVGPRSIPMPKEIDISKSTNANPCPTK
jgi:hypothetical protein